jgi:hypothetical protein
VTEKQAQLSQTWNSPGGLYIRSVLDGHIEDAQERLIALMDEPDKLTGKAAIRLAARRKALMDFRATILEELHPSTRQGQGK